MRNSNIKLYLTLLSLQFVSSLGLVSAVSAWGQTDVKRTGLSNIATWTEEVLKMTPETACETAAGYWEAYWISAKADDLVDWLYNTDSNLVQLRDYFHRISYQAYNVARACSGAEEERCEAASALKLGLKDLKATVLDARQEIFSLLSRP